QEALIRASQNLATFEKREDATLIDWLAKIVENEVLRQAEHFAAQKRDPRREEALDRPTAGETGLDLADALGDETAGPVTRVSRAELAEIVDECLTELPEDHREVILLRDYAGGSWSFVAERLDRPSADAAMQLYRRARIALAERVRRRS
ncbi:MAG: sigma-70 family RNA polymerase sigma factor, partial [Planctomycetota bacterium]|nr:sigma-70 family RNA polymerase sigma factor [Planctomycetota bacterium]